MTPTPKLSLTVPRGSLPLLPSTHSCIPADQSRETATINLQEPFFSGTRFHLVHRLTSLFGKRDFIPLLLLVRMDLLIPNMFLTLYLGLNMHHLHCRAVTSLSELYRQAGNAFPLPRCSPCQMWSCEDKAVRRSLDRYNLPFGGLLLIPAPCRGQTGSAQMDIFLQLHSQEQVTCNAQFCRRGFDFLVNGCQAMALEPSKGLPLSATLQKIPQC